MGFPHERGGPEGFYGLPQTLASLHHGQYLGKRIGHKPIVVSDFHTVVEINLEENEKAQEIIERDFDVHRVILQLSELVGQPIVPGKTLLFFDEIQSAPKALTMLRYFYEKIPTLHVIVAGSLIEFAIDLVGMPVGRITSFY